MRSALARQHGCPPENALTIHSHFEKLINLTKDPAYLSSIIRKQLINNHHRVRLVMVPDPDIAAKEQADEKETPSASKKRLSRTK